MKEGWKMKKLGDLCELIARGTSPVYSESDGFIVLNQKCIRDHKINFEQARIHDIISKKVSNEKVIRKGDVLINSTGTGTLGRLAQVKEEFKNVIVDSHITILRPSPDLFVENFFGWAMILIEDEIAQKGEGCGGQTELSRNAVKDDFFISFPTSLPEQQRIVSILDDAFAAIDQAKENIQRNLKNAKDLFQSELNRVFTNKGEGWVEKKLGEIAFVKSGGTPSRSKKEYWTGSIPWYSSGELNNLYTRDSDRFINEMAIENSNAKLFPEGSLLIGMYDTAALKMSILKTDATFNQAIAGVRPNDKIDLIFILHYINSIKQELLKQRRGVRQKNLSLEKIKDIPVYVPSLKTQQAVVQLLDAFSTETKNLETIYQQKLNNLEELKKSILQKAFSGELSSSDSKRIKNSGKSIPA